MGRDKLSIEVGGQTLIQRVHAALIGVCQEVLVVGRDVIRLEGVRRVGGERPGGQGPLAGIEAGLAAAKYPLVFVAAGDMPFLRESMVEYLLERLGTSGALAVVPRYQSRVIHSAPPTPARCSHVFALPSTAGRGRCASSSRA